ncbi:MAG: hypothetical protein K0R39_3498 [Symbiobacteriaceae bacterium]|nr:hypothetical protein [Symbiobacteriaceae bacterium]
MSDQQLRLLCEAFLSKLAEEEKGQAYRRIKLDGVTYEGLDLLWDGPDRILVISFCWSSDRLALSCRDFLHFTSACRVFGLHKKFHLALFHGPDLTGMVQDWPVGISVSAVPLSEEDRTAPPPWVQVKLGSLFFKTEPQTAAVLEQTDWRRFILRQHVEDRIRELAAASRQSLPADLSAAIDQMLDLAGGDPLQLPDQFQALIKQRWEGKP